MPSGDLQSENVADESALQSFCFSDPYYTVVVDPEQEVAPKQVPWDFPEHHGKRFHCSDSVGILVVTAQNVFWHSL